jgi:hypothetical protein
MLKALKVYRTITGSDTVGSRALKQKKLVTAFFEETMLPFS